MRAKTWIIAALAAIGLIIAACDNIAPTVPTDPEEVRVYDINTNISRMPTLQNPPESRTEEYLPAEYDNADIPGYNPSNPTAVYRVSQSLRSDLGVSLDPTSSIIWPGALIDGGSIIDGRYVPISIKRGPVTLSTSNYNQGLPFVTVPEATLSSVRGAISAILTSATHGSASSTPSFKTEDVYSASQFELAMGMSLNASAGKNVQAMASAGFDFSKTDIKSRKLVKFIQPYFSIDIDTPNCPAVFFAADVTWDKVKAALKSTTAPVYVASVNYGRAAYYCVESSYSAKEVETALQSAASVYIWKNTGVSTSAFMESSAATILRNSRITGWIIGGDGSAAALSAVGFENFILWLQDGNYSPSCPVQPLSYTLKYLKDDSVAQVALSSTYYIRDVVIVPSPSPASPEPSATPVTPPPASPTPPPATVQYRVSIDYSAWRSDYVVGEYTTINNNATAQIITPGVYTGPVTSIYNKSIVPYCPGNVPITEAVTLSASSGNVNSSSYIKVTIYFGSNVTRQFNISIPSIGTSSIQASTGWYQANSGPPMDANWFYSYQKLI